MGALAGGSAVVLMSVFKAKDAVQLVEHHGVGQMNLTDDMVAAMLEAAPGEIAFPSVRTVGFGSFNAGLADIGERAERRGLTLIGLYGMSETQAFFAGRDASAPLAVREVAGGFPLAEGAAVRIADPETGAPLPDGEAGEIQLQGPSRMAGYFEDARATRAAITGDGFFKTGDLGVMEADGQFTFLARMGDVLRLSGFLVSPAEIEHHIQAHGMVDGCQVVGVDTDAGPRAVGFVTLEAGADFDEKTLIRHCRRHLARYKTPARIMALDAFPVTRSANGTKIQRVRLREMAESEIRGKT
jgi:fatty-acyl-CoA synthase